MFKSKAHAIRGAVSERGVKRTLIALLIVPALALPAQAAAHDGVPLKGSERGTFTMPGPCDVNRVVVDVVGAGQSTQLGDYSGHYRECLNPATGAVTAGTFTLTAANGDKIFGTYSGQAAPTADPGVVNFQDPGVVTGGTGRFADASGTLTTSGLANLATGEYTGTVSGSLSRPTS